MKSLKITFILLFISLASFAQSGMVFQVIARDNNSAAIVDKTMVFTFRVSLQDGTDLYKETQQIRTDNFGVFSHVIGTGNAVTGTFGGVDFSQGNLKAIISVNNEGTDTQIYDQKFEYVPYARHANTAANGVPVGTIITSISDNIPEGYVECNGQSITDAKYANLRAALGGANNAPNLGGLYLKEVGASHNSAVSHGIDLRNHQLPSTQSHTHAYSGNHETNTTGNHNHNYPIENSDMNIVDYQHAKDAVKTKEYTTWRATADAGNHKHTVNVSGRTGHGGIYGNTQKDGNVEKENRPYSYGVRYLVKY